MGSDEGGAVILERLRDRQSEEAFTPLYWLRNCEGFRVDAIDGHLGYVEEVRLGPGLDAPDSLAVRSCRSGRLITVPVDAIDELLPHEERVVVTTPIDELDAEDS